MLYAKIDSGEIIDLATENEVRAMAQEQSCFLGEAFDEWEGWQRVLDEGADTPDFHDVSSEIEIFNGVPMVVYSYALNNDTRDAAFAAHLIDKRWRTETGGFYFNGIFIPTDEKTERRIIGARVKAEADPEYVIPNWSTDGGVTSIVLTAPMIIAISDAMDAHVQKCFSVMVVLRARLHEFESIAALEAAFDEEMEA